MNDLEIITQNGKHFIDSRDVADMVDKRHHNLLRDINNYIQALKKSSEIDISDFFRESTYIDSTGRTLPRYLLTKLGAELVVNKMTGQKGVLFRAAYVVKFDEIEKKEKLEAMLPRPQLAEYNSAAKLIVGVMKAANVPPDSIAFTMKQIYEPLGIPITLAGMTETKTYSATDIARLNGMVSASGRPHFLAIGAIISILNIGDEHKIIKPYQHGDTVSVCTNYDDYVVNVVFAWLEQNCYPCEISSGVRTFRVRYKNSKKTEV